MAESVDIGSIIARKALELGFSACGFAVVEPLVSTEAGYRKWLLSGKAGEMSYLARNVDLRMDPGKLVANAHTVISLAAGYYVPLPSHIPGTPRISRYASGKDYHEVLKSMARELLNWMRKEFGPLEGRVFCDSAPVLEREWAVRAGIGWIGKNGCLIIPSKGSWFFLAEIITDFEIRPDHPAVPDRCGNCTRCIRACPTGALSGDGSMDPRKCISYLTIEHRGPIPEEFRGRWEDWVFGCDICQDVCPWNKDPETSVITAFHPGSAWEEMNQITTGNLDPEKFNRVFGDTPVSRAGWSGIMRNFEFLQTRDPDPIT